MSLLSAAARLLGASPDPPTRAADLVTAKIRQRIVKVFAFDERKYGNYETVPMNWLPIVASGYPRFLEARFDMNVGHSSPPSFHFALRGGSLGAHYLAKDIPVHPGSDYRIEGWIRPAKLKHARAYITAYYLDHALRRIEGSDRRSAELRGSGEHELWTRVQVDLPGGFEHARWIGLSCRVEQTPVAEDGPPLFTLIQYRDVDGAAWFDDLRVMRLPRMRLRLGMGDGVFVDGQPMVCEVKMTDLDGAGLKVVLDVIDTDGRPVETHELRGSDLALGETFVPLADLPAGLYVARLVARVGDTPVAAIERSFLQLNADRPGRPRTSGGIGVIADSSLFAHPKLSGRLLDLLSPGRVKLPLWRESLSDDDIVRGEPGIGVVLEALHRMGATVVGVLEAPPTGLAEQYPVGKRSLISILASAPGSWRPYLALILTRYGHRVHVWQLGADVEAGPNSEPMLSQALANVHAEMYPLIGRPALAVPRSIEQPPPDDGLPADVLSVNVASHHASDRLAAQLAASDDDRFAERWATIRPPESDRYVRRWRLAEFARRLVVARSHGIDAVFVHQPWRIDTVQGEGVVTPAEEFFVVRTLNQALDGLTPAGAIAVSPWIESRLFVDETESRGALVLWSRGEATKDREVVLDVGDKARQIDIYSNVTTGSDARGGLAFSVGAMPTVITPVAPWRVRLSSSFTVRNPQLQPAVREQVRTVNLTNTHSLKLNGVLHLKPPAGWRIRPQKFKINLRPGASGEFEISLRLPTNEPAGDYKLVGRLEVDDEDWPSLTLCAPLAVNAPGLDVNVMAYRDGEVVRIVQRITNHTDDNLRLRAYMLSPNAARDVRFINNLATGQTTVREYEVREAAKLAGRYFRVSVEEVGGPLRHHTAIKLD